MFTDMQLKIQPVADNHNQMKSYHTLLKIMISYHNLLYFWANIFCDNFCIKIFSYDLPLLEEFILCKNVCVRNFCTSFAYKNYFATEKKQITVMCIHIIIMISALRYIGNQDSR